MNRGSLIGRRRFGNARRFGERIEIDRTKIEWEFEAEDLDWVYFPRQPVSPGRRLRGMVDAACRIGKSEERRRGRERGWWEVEDVRNGWSECSSMIWVAFESLATDEWMISQRVWTSSRKYEKEKMGWWGGQDEIEIFRSERQGEDRRSLRGVRCGLYTSLAYVCWWIHRLQAIRIGVEMNRAELRGRNETTRDETRREKGCDGIWYYLLLLQHRKEDSCFWWELEAIGHKTLVP